MSVDTELCSGSEPPPKDDGSIHPPHTTDATDDYQTADEKSDDGTFDKKRESEVVIDPPEPPTKLFTSSGSSSSSTLKTNNSPVIPPSLSKDREKSDDTPPPTTKLQLALITPPPPTNDEKNDPTKRNWKDEDEMSETDSSIKDKDPPMNKSDYDPSTAANNQQKDEHVLSHTALINSTKKKRKDEDDMSYTDKSIKDKDLTNKETKYDPTTATTNQRKDADELPCTTLVVYKGATRKISDYDPATVATNTQKNSSGKKATTLIAANKLADKNIVWVFNGRAPKTAKVTKIKPLHWKSQKPFKLLHAITADASCFDVAWRSKHAGNKKKRAPTVVGVHNLVKDIVSATSSKKSAFFF